MSFGWGSLDEEGGHDNVGVISNILSKRIHTCGCNKQVKVLSFGLCKSCHT